MNQLPWLGADLEPRPLTHPPYDVSVLKTCRGDFSSKPVPHLQQGLRIHFWISRVQLVTFLHTALTHAPKYPLANTNQDSKSPPCSEHQASLTNELPRAGLGSGSVFWLTLSLIFWGQFSFQSLYPGHPLLLLEKQDDIKMLNTWL